LGERNSTLQLLSSLILESGTLADAEKEVQASSSLEIQMREQRVGLCAFRVRQQLSKDLNCNFIFRFRSGALIGLSPALDTTALHRI